MRQIDADAFSAFIKDAVIRHKYDQLNIDNTMTVADVLQAVCAELDGTGLEGFKNAPTVDAVPVMHGRWQWLSSTYDRIPCEMRYWCSKCHHETITHDSEPWEKFCPNCGAKMDGKDNEQA